MPHLHTFVINTNTSYKDCGSSFAIMKEEAIDWRRLERKGNKWGFLYYDKGLKILNSDSYRETYKKSGRVI